MNGMILSMTSNVGVLLRILLVTIAFQIALVVPMVPHYGAAGAVATYVVINAILARRGVRHHTSLDPSILTYVSDFGSGSPR